MTNLVALCHDCHVIADQCDPLIQERLLNVAKYRKGLANNRKRTPLKVPKWRRP